MPKLLPWLKAKDRRTKGGGKGAGQPGGGGGNHPTVLQGTYQSTAESSSNSSTYTFSSQDLGPSNGRRPVLVGAVCIGGGGAGTGTMTVDGINADPLFVEGRGTGTAEFFLALNVNGATGDIVFVTGGSQTSAAIAVWRLNAVPNLLFADGDLIDTGTMALTTTEVGGFVAAIGIGAGKTAGTMAVSNLTARVTENNIESGSDYIAGDLIPDGTSETVDFAGTASVDGNSPQAAVSFAKLPDTATYPFEGTACIAAISFSRNLVRSGAVTGKYTDSSGAITQATNQVVGRPSFTDGGTSTRRPTLTTGGPNSKACADFDGSSDWLSSSTAFVSVSAKYVIVSVIPDTITTTQGAIVGAASSTWNITQQDVTGDKLFVNNFDGNTDTPTGTAATEGTVYVVELRHQGGTLGIRVNGGTEATVSSGNSTSVGNMTIGAQGSGAQFADCKIFELGVWSAPPSNRAAIVADMMAWVGAV